MFIAMSTVPLLFLLDKFICLYKGNGDVYCHEYCTITVPSGQVYLSFVRKWGCLLP